MSTLVAIIREPRGHTWAILRTDLAPLEGKIVGAPIYSRERSLWAALAAVCEYDVDCEVVDVDLTGPVGAALEAAILALYGDYAKVLTSIGLTDRDGVRRTIERIGRARMTSVHRAIRLSRLPVCLGIDIGHRDPISIRALGRHLPQIVASHGIKGTIPRHLETRVADHLADGRGETSSAIKIAKLLGGTGDLRLMLTRFATRGER